MNDYRCFIYWIIGAFFLGLVVRGLVTGQISIRNPKMKGNYRLGGGIISRKSRPLQFWFYVLIYSIAAIGAALVGVAAMK